MKSSTKNILIATLLVVAAASAGFVMKSIRNTAEEDSSLINPDNVHLYANTNAHLLNGSPKAIVLEFPGLGGGSCLGGSMDIGPYGGKYAEEMAENGILLAYLFSGPWSWMQKGSVRYTDLVVDALLKKYSLADGTPICVSGGSMGGHGAIIYASESRHKDKIRAVAAACPCFDLTDCMFSDPTFPRSFVLGVADQDCPLEEGLRKLSPIHRIRSLSRVPYFIACDGADQFFDAGRMKEFADKLEGHGAPVTFRLMEGLTHGGFTPEVRDELTSFLITNCKQ
ncbi:MAG: prolyl oligopeptidase family serine peptidase [Bacteroidales bacterium]|nr:prolyl oligopeptidase family serine peptidase [Bacteroidales bacterium]